MEPSMTRSHTQKVAQKIRLKAQSTERTQTFPTTNSGFPDDRTEAAGSETEAQLRAALEKMEQANKVQRGFISVVSHEFRSTLAGIQGFSELLRDREMGPAKTREFATIIYNDARRLDGVIGELLDLERMMVGQIQPHLEAVDLPSLLTTEAEKAQAQTTRHTLHLRFEQQLPAFAADPELLQQMSSHLFSNAIKYAPDGGEIWVGAQLTANIVHIVFHDQGIGIPPESLEEVFMPFRRLKSSQTRTVKGAGLGLTLVQQIVLLHQGKIWIESTPGEGSTVYISLPWFDPASIPEENDQEA
jgi:signal transduction histidine kinase